MPLQAATTGIGNERSRKASSAPGLSIVKIRKPIAGKGMLSANAAPDWRWQLVRWHALGISGGADIS
jgi:hypothetical protein